MIKNIINKGLDYLKGKNQKDGKQEIRNVLEEKISITVGYDNNRDIKNWRDACNRQSWGTDRKKSTPKEISEKIHGKNLAECKSYIGQLIEKEHIKEIEKKMFLVEKVLKDKSFMDALNKLENITGYKIPFDQIKIFITSFPRSPYDNNRGAFMIYYKREDLINTLLHETLHFIFHYHFEKNLTKKGILSEDEFGDLKEAQTVILNYEFKDILNHPDYGYPNHQEFRKELAKQREKERDYEKLIEFGIQYLKTHSL